jgi:hypothetical protein
MCPVPIAEQVETNAARSRNKLSALVFGQLEAVACPVARHSLTQGALSCLAHRERGRGKSADCGGVMRACSLPHLPGDSAGRHLRSAACGSQGNALIQRSVCACYCVGSLTYLVHDQIMLTIAALSTGEKMVIGVTGAVPQLLGPLVPFLRSNSPYVRRYVCQAMRC